MSDSDYTGLDWRTMMEAMRQSRWRQVPVMLLGTLLLVPVFAVPIGGAWSGMRIFAVQAIAFGLLALFVVSVRWSAQTIKSFITTGPNVALVLLIIWAALSFVLSARGNERGREIALVEFLRMASGAAIYVAAMFFCRSGRHLRQASLVLSVGCLAAGLAGVLSASLSSMDYITAGFGDSQLLGAFLTGLLPLTIVLAASGDRTRRCVIAWVAAPLVGAALLLTGNRSGWLGASVGLVLVGVLATRSGMIRLTCIPALLRERRSALMVLTAPLFIYLYVGLSGAGTIVIDRAKTLTTLSTDVSVVTRLHTWAITGEMLLQRPLTGWGIGSFPLEFGKFYERGGGDQTRYPVPSAAQVERDGVGLSSMAHNEYLQLGAELGLVGLALYLTVLGRFFYSGIRALRQLPTGPRRWFLLATLGAVAAQCVDGLANPGWRFADVSPLLWLLLGLGMAAARPHTETHLASGLRTPNGRRHTHGGQEVMRGRLSWVPWRGGVGAHLKSTCAVVMFLALLMAIPGGPLYAFPPERFFWHGYIYVPGGFIAETHQDITERAILGENRHSGLLYEFFGVSEPTASMRAAVADIVTFNSLVDFDQYHSAKHFDAENFAGGQAFLESMIRIVKLNLAKHSKIGAARARIGLGQALHTVQDFYAHSNWVNLGYATPHPEVGRPGGLPISQWDPPIADLSQPTCTANRDFLLPAFKYVPQNIPKYVTSGYYGGEDRLEPPGIDKCRHGGFFDSSPGLGGINLDTYQPQLTPNYLYLHAKAADVARLATQKFIRDLRPLITYSELSQLLGGPDLPPPHANDVSSQTRATRSGLVFDPSTLLFSQQITIRNASNVGIAGPVAIVLNNLSPHTTLVNLSGVTGRPEPRNRPYVNVDVGPDNVLEPGEFATTVLAFENLGNAPISYSVIALNGAGVR